MDTIAHLSKSSQVYACGFSTLLSSAAKKKIKKNEMLKGEGFGVSISREMIIQFLILHIEPTAKVIPRKNTIDPITSLIHYLSHVTLYVAREFGAKK